jgi:TatA/E family protein of Tat protein translocase
MPNIGPLEIAIVAIIALVIFGPKRLPELGHGLGRGMREFKSGITGKDEAVQPTAAIATAPAASVVTTAGANGASVEPSSVAAAAVAPVEPPKGDGTSD